MASSPATLAAQTYEQTRINTSNKQRAICLLHDKCVLFIEAAARDAENRRSYVIKSQNILSQLEMALVKGDAVADSLFFLYDYCYVLLERGTETDFANAATLLASLRDTFNILRRYPR